MAPLRLPLGRLQLSSVANDSFGTSGVPNELFATPRLATQASRPDSPWGVPLGVDIDRPDAVDPDIDPQIEAATVLSRLVGVRGARRESERCAHGGANRGGFPPAGVGFPHCFSFRDV